MRKLLKSLSTLTAFLALTLGVGYSLTQSNDVVGAKAVSGDVVASWSDGASGYTSGYKKQTANINNIDWVMTMGQKGWFGANKAATHNGAYFSGNDLNAAKAVDVEWTDITLGMYGIIPQSKLQNISKVEFTYSADSGNSASTKVYLAISDSIDSVYTLVNLSSGIQGGTPNNRKVVFEFDTLLDKYYALLFKTSSYARFTSASATFFEGETTSSKVLNGISVTGQPDKTEYYEGEIFDPTGLTITASYSDDSNANVTLQTSFSPSILTEGVTSVTAAYTEGDITKTADISGINVVTRNIISISVLMNPTKMTYLLNQSFDPEGMIVSATYNVGPTNDDYTAYIYSPTSTFTTLGENTVTISSLDDPNISTVLTVDVINTPEGDYGITSGATDYQNPMNPNSLIIEKSNENLSNLTFNSIDNVRLYGSPITGSIMIGSGSTNGGTFAIELDSSLFATKIEFVNNVKDTGATETKKLTVNDVSVEFASINESDSIVFKPYSNSIVITTDARLWVEEIIITVNSAENAAINYGSYFLAETDAECVSSNVLLNTWNKLASTYEGADVEVKNYVQSASANNEGNDLEKAISRYTYIMSKYAYNDFINGGTTQGSREVIKNSTNDNLSSVVLIASLGLSALVGYYFINKKKQYN